MPGATRTKAGFLATGNLRRLDRLSRRLFLTFRDIRGSTSCVSLVSCLCPVYGCGQRRSRKIANGQCDAFPFHLQCHRWTTDRQGWTFVFALSRRTQIAVVAGGLGERVISNPLLPFPLAPVRQEGARSRLWQQRSSLFGAPHNEPAAGVSKKPRTLKRHAGASRRENSVFMSSLRSVSPKLPLPKSPVDQPEAGRVTQWRATRPMGPRKRA